eukprot:10924048-Lingulodinium_polyedra.AAC.1
MQPRSHSQQGQRVVPAPAEGSGAASEDSLAGLQRLQNCCHEGHHSCMRQRGVLHAAAAPAP